MNVKPILLATDGSPSAAEATLEAVELAKAFDTSLLVISVEHPPLLAGTGFYGYGELLGEIRKVENERIDGALSQAMAVAAEAGIACEGIHGGDEASVADQVCRLAATRKARLIVIGAHGWGAMRRVLHGSVSTAVVHLARCPVLVVPSGTIGSSEFAKQPADLVHAGHDA
jgi:nucleotide-binding universal stress UspA family protein